MLSLLMNLPTIKGVDVSGKKVIVRGDLDVSDISEKDFRLKSLIPTLQYLLENKAKIILIGHSGRPGGVVDNKHSLKPIIDVLAGMLNTKINFVYDLAGVEAKAESNKLKEGEMMCLENLRFDKREEENDKGFAKSISELGDIYVNETFGVSHRNHASIVGIPKLLPHYAGIHLVEEIENLNKVINNPKRPLVILLSGIKDDKLKMIDPLSEIADKVLIGGRLPDLLGDRGLESIRLQGDDRKVLIGNLIMDKEDISLNTIERFEKEVLKAKTVVLAGVLGKYEDEGHTQGTIKVFTAVANSAAFKIVGGGDSLKAINQYGLSDKFDWISTGGGAMIEYIINKTLPGLEALVD